MVLWGLQFSYSNGCIFRITKAMFGNVYIIYKSVKRHILKLPFGLKKQNRARVKIKIS